MTAAKQLPIFYTWTLAGGLAMYVLRILLARHLSPTAYGAFFAVVGLVLFLKLFNDLGFSGSMLYWWGKSKPMERRSLFTMVVLVKAGLALLVGSLFVLFRQTLAVQYFHMPELEPGLAIFGAFFLFQAIEQLLWDYFASVGRSGLYAAVPQVRKLAAVILAGVTILVGATPLLFWLLLSWMAAAIITALGLALLVPWRSLLVRPRARLLPRTARYAFFLTLSGLGGVLLARLDVLFITYFRGTAEVGYYEAALPVAMILFTIVSPFAQFLRPFVVQRADARDSQKLGETLSAVYNAGIFFLLPLSLGIVTFPKEILRLLFGAEYLLATTALALLGVGFLFKSLHAINSTFLFGIGKAKSQMQVLWLGAGLNVALNALLVPHYGFIAAAWTTVLSFAAMFVATMWMIAKRFQLRLPWRNWLKVAALSLLVITATMLLKRVITLNLYLEAVLLGAFFLLGYYGIGIFVLHIVDRERLWRVVGQLSARFWPKT